VNARVHTPAVFPRVTNGASKKTEIDLNDWILAAPANRCVWGVDKLRGVWRVGLSVSIDGMHFDRLPCGSGATYAEAVANAIEIARLTGHE
jgi:hypothetical protein